jgi:hypothetical protein
LKADLTAHTEDDLSLPEIQAEVARSNITVLSVPTASNAGAAKVSALILRITGESSTSLAHSSYKWQTMYNKRSSVERVNSRLDESFGFEKHFIRGINKTQARCGPALIVILGIAQDRVE